MTGTAGIYSWLPSIFSAHGTGAILIAALGWALTGISAIVVLGILAQLGVGLFRPRPPQRPDYVERPHPGPAIRLIIVGGIAVPVIILVAAYGATLGVQNASAAPAAAAANMIEITGHRWWWEIRYRGATDDQTFTTANELHVPVDQPVRIRLMSDDVIHSFWVPNLAGKTDVIPGQDNTMWIEARDSGVFRGECAEYCGPQHAHMDLVVVAQPRAQYDAWLGRQREPAARPRDSAAVAGEAVFHRSACASCHTISGTGTLGVIGPDLTHVASRKTIGAGLLPNTKATLAGWVENAQALKPDIAMPAMSLNGPDLRALVDYLETLK